MTPTQPDPLRTADHAPAADSTLDRSRSRTDTSPPLDPGPAARPDRVPGYVVEGELGRGGMGVVYKAVHVAVEPAAAVKMVLGEVRPDSHGLIRFLAEAGAVAAVKHAHVVGVYDYGDADGRPFLALEFCPGGSLADRLKAGRLSPAAAAGLLGKLAAGVGAAGHDAGIVHRDLKPGNVLFDAADEPKVSDFGLAKRVGGADLTRTQAVMGTPAYMSPEQAKGETKFVGPQADVWALGVILYECLTGTRPFAGDDSWAVLRRVLTHDPVWPRAAAPDVPRDLDLIVRKCLAKEPHERYASANELAADLANFLAGRPVSVRAVSAPVRAWKWVRRNPVPAALIASLAALVVITGLGGYLTNRQLERANAAEVAKSQAEQQRAGEESNRLRAEQKQQVEAAQAAIQFALRGGKAKEALAAVADAERAGVTLTPAIRLDRARAYNVLSRTDDALRELMALRADGVPPEVRGEVDLLEGTLRMGGWTADNSAALALIDRALEDPALPAAERLYAEGLKAPLAVDAAAKFEAAVRHDPAHVDARAMAVLAYFSLGRLDDALRLGEQSRPFAPTHPYFTTLLVGIWTFRGDVPRLTAYLDELRPSFPSAAHFDDFRQAMLLMARLRGTAGPPVSQNPLAMLELYKAVNMLDRATKAARTDPAVIGMMPSRFPPFFRNAVGFVIDELLAAWQSNDPGAGNPLVAGMVRQLLPDYVPGTPVLRFTDRAGAAAARERLRRHPEGSLKGLYAARLYKLADDLHTATKADAASRDLLAEAGAAFEDAARTPGLLSRPTDDLELAYTCYWLAGSPIYGRPVRADWLAKARDLLLDRLRITPGFAEADDFRTATRLCIRADDFSLARLVLDDWGRSKAAKPPEFLTLRASVDANLGAYEAALSWLDKLPEPQRTKDPQAQSIRAHCLRALHPPESAPPPRPVK